MIEIQLPFPPSANRLWRRAGHTIHKSKTYTDWLKEAGWQVIAQKSGGISGPYTLHIQAKRPDKRRRDIDNLIKPISDLLVSVGAVEDDSHCEFVSARWVTSGVEGITARIDRAVTE